MLDPIADNIFRLGQYHRRQERHCGEGAENGGGTGKESASAATTPGGRSVSAQGAEAVRPAGDLNNSTEPGAVELSPDQSHGQEFKADPVEWNARIEALRNVGLEALDIAEAEGHQGAVGRGRESRTSV